VGWDEAHAKKVLAAFPDMFGMTHEQITGLLSWYLSIFNAKEKLRQENQDVTPIYSTAQCVPNQVARTTSWYPGWKYQATDANMIAFAFLG
jgi:hypothetical protein